MSDFPAGGGYSTKEIFEAIAGLVIILVGLLAVVLVISGLITHNPWNVAWGATILVVYFGVYIAGKR